MDTKLHPAKPCRRDVGDEGGEAELSHAAGKFPGHIFTFRYFPTCRPCESLDVGDTGVTEDAARPLAIVTRHSDKAEMSHGWSCSV